LCPTSGLERKRMCWIIAEEMDVFFVTSCIIS
jgi:hypothetical protein